MCFWKSKLQDAVRIRMVTPALLHKIMFPSSCSECTPVLHQISLLSRYKSTYGWRFSFISLFLFAYVIIYYKHFSRLTGISSSSNLTCRYISKIHQDWHHFPAEFLVKVKGQGHFRSFLGSRRNPYFLSSFYWIDFKFCGKVAYMPHHKPLIFGASRTWPSKDRLRVKKLTPWSKLYLWNG